MLHISILAKLSNYDTYSNYNFQLIELFVNENNQY